MNFFYLSPEDRDWLKCLLMKHAFLLTLILCFWLILNAWPKAETPVSRVDESDTVQFRVPQEGSEAAAAMLNRGRVRAWVEDGPQAIKLVDLPLDSVNAVEPKELVSTSSLKRPGTRYLSRAVQPTGWRRTRNGWENTANWRTSLASLGDIVRQQQEREPDWFQALLARVRSVPPWGVALFQLSAVGGVLLFERRAARKQLSQVISSEV
jgi:hypothetical protein